MRGSRLAIAARHRRYPAGRLSRPRSGYRPCMGEQETGGTAEEQEQPKDEGSGEEERDFDQEVEDAKEEVKDLEDDPPENLEDWPSGRAKYETFGGPEHETSYNEAATSKLGPSDVRFHEDGKVEVDGEEADDPDEFKADPIPGGPTDPDAPGISGEEQEERQEQEGDDQQGDEQEGDKQED